MNRIIGVICLAAVAITVAGCGGGHGPNDNLLTLRPGRTWVYALAGNVTLPDSLGGGTQALRTTSTFTVQVANSTSRDLNNTEVGILDRKIDAFLLDGREMKGNFRLYFSQSDLGIFVHGINVYAGDTFNAANDNFVPATASSPFKFLYLPNPFLDSQTLSYSNPLGVSATPLPDVAYTLQVGSPRQQVKVPAGDFFAKPVSIVENFNRTFALSTTLTPFSVTSAAFDPSNGLVGGVFKATLPDGTSFTGTIQLKSISG